mmetsp:Transcript_27620/g.92779  ORF Transcript_27620/g.92779 Transcript_27620/m.92779 type:complete len:286 (-) Transcript_27620:84-941(-)
MPSSAANHKAPPQEVRNMGADPSGPARASDTSVAVPRPRASSPTKRKSSGPWTPSSAEKKRAPLKTASHFGPARFAGRPTAFTSAARTVPRGVPSVTHNSLGKCGAGPSSSTHKIPPNFSLRRSLGPAEPMSKGPAEPMSKSGRLESGAPACLNAPVRCESAKRKCSRTLPPQLKPSQPHSPKYTLGSDPRDCDTCGVWSFKAVRVDEPALMPVNMAKASAVVAHLEPSGQSYVRPGTQIVSSATTYFACGANDDGREPPHSSSCSRGTRHAVSTPRAEKYKRPW